MFLFCSWLIVSKILFINKFILVVCAVFDTEVILLGVLLLCMASCFFGVNY